MAIIGYMFRLIFESPSGQSNLSLKKQIFEYL